MNNHNSGYEILEFIILRNFHNFSFKYKKLDQETWLCWTHLDDLVDTIFTILYHVRPYYTILEHFGQGMNHSGQFWIILNRFEKF